MTGVDDLEVREPTAAERAELDRMLAAAWGAPVMVAHGTVYDLRALPALIAVHNGQTLGAVTWREEAGARELTSVNAFADRRGVGTALVERAARDAAARGCHTLWCTTTNDNVDALRFYQRRGFRLVRLRPGAVDQARLIKPEIPPTGAHGIALRDELDLERPL